jgi:tetratricopeptide (TPR) repeat protein
VKSLAGVFGVLPEDAHALAAQGVRSAEQLVAVQDLPRLSSSTGIPLGVLRTYCESAVLDVPPPDRQRLGVLVLGAVAASLLVSLSMWAYAEGLSPKLDSAVAQYNHGNASLRSGDVSRAIREYRDCLDLKPNSAAAENNLAVALMEAGDYSGAAGRLREGLRVNSKSAVIHSNLGVLFARAGRYDAAIEQFREAIRSDPRASYAYTNLGAALASGEGDYSAAIEELKRAISLDPNDANAHTSLGGALATKGDYDAAIDQLEMAVRLNPDSVDAHNNLGLALSLRSCSSRSDPTLRKRDSDAAIAELNRALAIKPDSWQAYTILGNLMFREGKYEAALGVFMKALALVPNVPYAHYNVALALRALGRNDEAEREFEAARRLDPGSPPSPGGTDR